MCSVRDNYEMMLDSGKKQKASSFLLGILFPCKALLLVDPTWPPCGALELPPFVWFSVVGTVLDAKLQ